MRGSAVPPPACQHRLAFYSRTFPAYSAPTALRWENLHWFGIRLQFAVYVSLGGGRVAREQNALAWTISGGGAPPPRFGTRGYGLCSLTARSSPRRTPRRRRLTRGIGCRSRSPPRLTRPWRRLLRVTRRRGRAAAPFPPPGRTGGTLHGTSLRDKRRPRRPRHSAAAWRRK